MDRTLVVALAVVIGSPALGQTGPGDLEAILRDLRSPSFEVRSRAQERLGSFGPERLGELRRAAGRTREAEVRERLRLAIERLLIEVGRERGLRGDSFTCLRFGPFEPGPVAADVLVPQRASWSLGVHGLLLVANDGEEEVEVRTTYVDFVGSSPEELQAGLSYDRSRRGDTCGTGLGGWYESLWLGDLVLAPGETRALALNVHGWIDPWQFDRGESIEFGIGLYGTIALGACERRFRIDWEPRAVVELVPAGEGEAAAATAEVVELGGRDLRPWEIERLRYLLGRWRRERLSLSAETLRSAYERAAGRSEEAARAWFGALSSAMTEADLIEFAVGRIRAGDWIPLPEFAPELPPGDIACLVRILGSEDPRARCAAIRSLTRLEDSTGSDRVVRLLDDQDTLVQVAALDHVQALAVPCGDRLAALLPGRDPNHLWEILKTLVLIGARDQVPVLVDLLARHEAGRFSILRALGELGGPPEVVRPYLDDPDQFVRAAAVGALGALGAVEDADRIATMLADPKVKAVVMWAAIGALGDLRSTRHVSLIRRVDPGGRGTFAALGTIGGDEAIEHLEGVLRDRSASERSHAVLALARALPAERALELLAEILRDDREFTPVREAALDRLGALGPAGAREIRSALEVQELALPAMWELSRYSAPRLLERAPSVVWPRGRTPSVGQFLARLRAAGIDATSEGLGNLESLGIRPRTYPRVDLEELVLEICRHHRSAAFILTDDTVRFVPREEAIAFYRALDLGGAAGSK